MAEASDIEIQKDAEAVDKGARGDLIPGEFKRKTARVKQMEQLNMKIKTMNTMLTKNMNGLEKQISAFEKLESEQALVTKVRRKAIELLRTQA